MKNLCCREIDRFRIAHPMGDVPDDLRAWGGCFQVPFSGKMKGFGYRASLRVIASRGGGSADIGGDDPYSRWDHVSVSLPDRCPTWEEMSFIKELFFERGEPAMQLHPAKDYVNNHPYCLHLWRPLDAEVPLPFPEMVGIPGLEFAA